MDRAMQLKKLTKAQRQSRSAFAAEIRARAVELYHTEPPSGFIDTPYIEVGNGVFVVTDWNLPESDEAGRMGGFVDAKVWIPNPNYKKQ